MTLEAQHTTVEYLTMTKIGEKGQITVSKRFRQDLRLEAGGPFAVLRVGDGLILLPEQQRFEHLCRRMGSALASAGLKGDDLLATLPEARQRVFDRHYRAAPSRRASTRERSRGRRAK